MVMNDFTAGRSGGVGYCPIGRVVRILDLILPSKFPVWTLSVFGRVQNLGDFPQAAKVSVRMGSGLSGEIVKIADVSNGVTLIVPAGSIMVDIDCTYESISGDAASRGSGFFEVTCVPGTKSAQNAYFTAPIPPVPPNSFSTFATIPPFASDYMFRWNTGLAGFPGGTTTSHITSPTAESPVTTVFRGGYTYGSSPAFNLFTPMPWQPIVSARLVEVYNLSLVDSFPGDFIFKIR